MAYLDYPGLSYFKSLLDETYLRTSYTGDTTIAGDVTFTGDTVFSEDITGNVDGKAKKDWKGQQIDSTYIKEISTNDNVGQIVYTKGDGTSNYIIIDMMQGATASTAGKAGLVPAPTISERTKFLRGDGEWGVPTDIYVTQNLINTNDSFPILIGATAGATESQIGTAIAFGTKVSVNPNTHALIADHLILKHPTYRRNNNVSSKIMYTLNFADSDDGNGNNLSEIYGYIDPIADGGEHELGFRLFGNPNVQGVEEIFTYLSVGLSNTNIPYGHAPSTPLPADHNEGTDIITRDWLARNGSETGLVHTTMDETINGIKTFVKKIVANDGMNATGNIASDTLTVRQDATVGRDLAVTRNETVGGTLTTTGNISTASGNISTTNGTVSGKTGSIGTGGLTVTGPSNFNNKVTASNGLDVTGNTETDTLTVTDDAVIGDTITVGDQLLKKTGTNTTQEYVSYVTNQQETRNTIITNVVKPNGGLAVVNSGNDKGKIYVKTGNALEIDSSGFVNVDFSKLPPEQVKSIVDRMVDPDGAIIGSTQERIPAGETYHYYDNNGNLVSAVAPAGGIANPNYGKLTVDFSKLSSSQIEAIVLSMIAQDGQGNLTGGLATDNNGKLVVDFSQMPDDKFDTLKASLGMQRTVTSATKTFYVDYDSPNANDTVYTKATGFDSERGLSLNRPFKTISGAVTGITTYYSIGNQNVTIYVVPRHVETNPDYPYYREYVNLPTYNRTSGVITIRGYIDNNKTENNSYVVENNENVMPMPKILSNYLCGTTIGVTGRYNLRYVELYNRVRDPGNSAGNFPSVISISEGGNLALYGVHEHFEFYGHRGAVGTIEITSDTAPTEIIMNSSASSVGAVPIMSGGKFFSYEYKYDPSTHKEIEIERPELKTTSTVNIEGTDRTFNNYITIISYNYNTNTKKVTLKYMFERGAVEISSTTFYIKVGNGNFVPVTPVYDNLAPRTGIYARMHTVINGKLTFGIEEKLNTRLMFNIGTKHSASETFNPSLNMFNTLSILRAERNGQIETNSNATISVPYTNIYCEGNMTTFVEITEKSSYTNVSGQAHQMHYVVKPENTVTGKPYTLSSGSGINTSHAIIEQVNNGITEWVSGNAGCSFPCTANIHGTIEDEEGFDSENPNYSYRKGGSGCWYKEHSSLGL